MDAWSAAFLAFLRGSNYQNVQMKTGNIKNIFNLLFVPETRTKDLGQPPSIDSLIQYMIENGALSCDADMVTVTPEN